MTIQNLKINDLRRGLRAQQSSVETNAILADPRQSTSWTIIAAFSYAYTLPSPLAKFGLNTILCLEQITVKINTALFRFSD
jgi:hypothetical protein